MQQWSGWAGGLGAIALATVAVAASGSDSGAETAKAIATIRGVSREGGGNDAAGPAWKALVSQGASALVPTLEAIDDANPTASNWLRTAVDAIAENEAKAGRSLPVDKLLGFVRETKFAPSARRLAYELLIQQDPAFKDRLLPEFLNDPNADLRRDAVAAELAKLEKGSQRPAKADLEKLFVSARDKDQVEQIAKKLEEDHKVRVSIAEHFAFITRWSIVGPFDRPEGKDPPLANPPERATDLARKYPGRGGAELTWKSYTTTDRYGTVDLNKVIGKEKDAAAYALARVQAAVETPCEIRVTSPNAVQIFLNGEKLFEREEYHHGETMDHHVGRGVLRAKENVMVVKVCQNNQTDSWAQQWKFQVRVCDATGGPLPGVTQVIPTNTGVEQVKLGSTPAPEEKK